MKKRNEVIIKIDLVKNDFETSVKVKRNRFSAKDKTLLLISLFSLKGQIDKLMTELKND